MFLGEFKSKKPINLGKKTTQDRNELLRKAQLEREKRELERKQFHSILIIQKAWRLYRTRAIQKQNQRIVFDEQLRITKSLDSIFQLGFSLCFFYQPQIDKDRLVIYIKRLLEFEWTESIPVFLIQKLTMKTCQTALVSPELWCEFILRILQDTKVQEYTISYFICTLQILKILQYEFIKSISRHNQRLLESCQAIFNALLHAISLYPSLHSIFIIDFCRYYFVLKDLHFILSIQHISTLVPSMIVALSCHRESVSSYIIDTDIPQFLYNLIEFTDLNFNDLNFFNQWTLVLYDLLSALPSDTNSELDDSDSDQEEIQQEKEIEKFDIIKLIESRLFPILLNSFHSPSSRPIVSSLFVLLLFKWPEKQDLILNRLLFKSSRQLLLYLHDSMVNGPLWPLSLLEPVPILQMLDYTLQEWSCFLLFCCVFTRQSLTMTDSEFFKFENMPDMVSVSCTIKNLTFALFWEDKIPPFLLQNQIPMDFTRILFAKFLNQLHMRDCRRPFCPNQHWHISNEADLQQISILLVSASQDSSPSSTFTMINNINTTSASTTSTTSMERVKGLRSSRLFAAQQILEWIPFVIPFQTRVQLFRSLVNQDKLTNVAQGLLSRATIKRNHMFEDGYAQLNALGSKLKGKVSITFISEHGLEEAGIDGGGVFKEFLTGLAKQAFDPDYGLFVSTRDEFIYPCPNSLATQEPQISYFEFLGRIIGKALYEGVLVDVGFADFFLAKWCQKQNFLEDLPSLDPELYSGLLFLKNYQGDVEKDLSLNFTANENDFGESKTIELIPNGSSIPVTNENRIQYIYLAAHYKVNIRIQKQCQAFFRGLQDLIHPLWLRMFHQQELQLLLGGTSIPIDLQDLQMNCMYSGGFDAQHPTILLLWEILFEFTQEELKEFIRFVTSCPRPPLLGFGALSPKFCIRNAGSQDLDRLPTASTCVNLLKLPNYTDKKVMESKLKYSIHFGAGFDLS